MEENIRKVSKMRLLAYADGAVKRGRVHRFSKWCAERYNMSWRGIYENFRSVPPLRWKWEGMESCVREFRPGHKGTLKDFWNSCTKNHFVEFMKDKDISRGTLWKKFDADNWTDLEKKGIKATYEWWLENVELKEN